ncbi:MAG TPA: hypothetical protein PKG71_00855 [Candidatus Woesebacteria bacterium]|nr:hypothetical protein [Candidatus Woesebacteria bacterium]HNS94501.1 hypothetical protein [Candidatus Woesebacteria bacterium]
MGKVKFLPILLVLGMVIGLSALGITYLMKAGHVVDSVKIKGVRAYGGFLQQSEADVLGTQAKTEAGEYHTYIYYFNEDKFNTLGANDYTSSITRTTPRTDLATFSIEQIVRGPVEDEMLQGFRPTFGTGAIAQFAGESRCGIKQFFVTLDPENYFAQVTFCKPITTDVDWGYRFITQQIRKTLIQFERIHKVRIVTIDDTCLDGSPSLEPTDCVY